MAGREKLADRDIIVVHRPFKNAVDERLGGRTEKRSTSSVT
jgi:hypothetical protein